MGSPLPLRQGSPPRPPWWPGGKPKVYFATGVLCVVAGIVFAIAGLSAPRRGPNAERREGIISGGGLTLIGAALVAFTWSSRQRQPRARSALGAWARERGFDRPEPDIASGSWNGTRLTLRIVYGAAHTRGDARGWLVEVGEAPRRGWVIVNEVFEDESAIRERLGHLADAAVASARALPAA